MSDIVVIGGGGHAKVILSVLNKIDGFRVLGYTDRVDKGEILGARYLGDDTELAKLIRNSAACAAAVGFGILGPADIDLRSKVGARLENLGFDFPAVVSPDAVVNAGVKVGRGTVVFDGAVINAGSSIGEFAIVNTGSSIDHDCTVGDNVHVAPGAVLCGGIDVGDNTFVGAGAVIKNGIRIGEGCVIGAGAVVIQECRSGGTYVGVPAKLAE